jgi:CubicO group peptidase (beta-lactamase class C family)
MIKFVPILFLLLIVVLSCQTKEEPKEIAQYIEPVPTNPYEVDFEKLSKVYVAEKEQKIAQFYKDVIANDGFSGGFLVAQNGEIIYENYNGYINYKTKEEMTNETPIHLASISKVITAAVILQLVDEKLLDLDQKLQTIFPEFPHQAITIRMLLNHRSGLPHYSYFSENKNIWNSNKTLTNQIILDLLNTKRIPLEYKPNTRFAYCNTNYALLALVVEKITQLDFKTAVKKRVFEPLEMNNSFVLDFEKQKEIASLTYKSTWQKVPLDHLDGIYGDKNIYSTPRDLLKLDLALYSDAFISKTSKEEAFKGYSYEKKGVKNYGLGIRLNEFDNGTTVHYHNGWWHGNTTSYVSLKNEKVTIIALANKYTKKVYQAKRLASLFGDYPFELD